MDWHHPKIQVVKFWQRAKMADNVTMLEQDFKRHVQLIKSEKGF